MNVCIKFGNVQSDTISRFKSYCCSIYGTFHENIFSTDFPSAVCTQGNKSVHKTFLFRLTHWYISKVRLFADDCLIYRNIKNKEDHIALQKDLHLFEN